MLGHRDELPPEQRRRIRATLDDGRPVLQHLDAGMVAYRAVGQDGLDPHTISNAGPVTSHHFVVELLGLSSAPAARPAEHNGRGRTEFPGLPR